MKKWEYMVVIRRFEREKSNERTLLPTVNQIAESYGKQGWELVTVIPMFINRRNVPSEEVQCLDREKWIFKRQIE